MVNVKEIAAFIENAQREGFFLTTLTFVSDNGMFTAKICLNHNPVHWSVESACAGGYWEIVAKGEGLQSFNEYCLNNR